MSSESETGLIRFEIRDGMRRIRCAISNETLDAASGQAGSGTMADRRRSFERFRTVIHAAALRRSAAQPAGSADPIVVSDRDLRDVPAMFGEPRFGSSGFRSSGTVAPAAAPAVAPAPAAGGASTVEADMGLPQGSN